MLSTLGSLTTKGSAKGGRRCSLQGCDYHPSVQQIAWVDKESGEWGELRLRHCEAAEQFYRGKLSSSINFSMCWASKRSFLCLRTRLARISAGSPTHNSKFSSPNKRSNQPECPVASIPTRTLTPFSFSSR